MENQEPQEVKITTKKAKEAYALLKAIKLQMAELETQKAQATEILAQALNGAKRGVVAGQGSYVLQAGKNTSFDRALMKEKFPVAFDECLRTTEYEYIKLV
jgi:predicted nucleotide-binding protein (sugar kinase/HSP70/actin superfamily)